MYAYLTKNYNKSKICSNILGREVFHICQKTIFSHNLAICSLTFQVREIQCQIDLSLNKISRENAEKTNPSTLFRIFTKKLIHMMLLMVQGKLICLLTTFCYVIFLLWGTKSEKISIRNFRPLVDIMMIYEDF